MILYGKKKKKGDDNEETLEIINSPLGFLLAGFSTIEPN